MAEQTQQRQKVRRVKIRFVALRPPAAEGEDPLVVASNPQPSWMLHVHEAQGVDLGAFELWHPLDLVSGETLKLMAIERETAGVSGEAYMGRIREQVGLLVPDLPADLFERLSGHQLLSIGIRAWQRPGETRQEAKDRDLDATNPPVGERDLVSSSRSPLGSTDGATRS